MQKSVQGVRGCPKDGEQSVCVHITCVAWGRGQGSVGVLGLIAKGINRPCDLVAENRIQIKISFIYNICGGRGISLLLLHVSLLLC